MIEGVGADPHDKNGKGSRLSAEETVIGDVNQTLGLEMSKILKTIYDSFRFLYSILTFCTCDQSNVRYLDSAILLIWLAVKCLEGIQLIYTSTKLSQFC